MGPPLMARWQSPSGGCPPPTPPSLSESPFVSRPIWGAQFAPITLHQSLLYQSHLHLQVSKLWSQLLLVSFFPLSRHWVVPVWSVALWLLASRAQSGCRYRNLPLRLAGVLGETEDGGEFSETSQKWWG